MPLDKMPKCPKCNGPCAIVGETPFYKCGYCNERFPIKGFAKLSKKKRNKTKADLQGENLVLQADLATANERIEALEEELAINKNAYSEWYKRCLVVEAERDKLRGALREAEKALRLAPQRFYKDADKAAALLGDAKEERDEKAE